MVSKNLLSVIDLARNAHAGQVRKYTGEPYIVHPFAVTGLVASVSDDVDMLSAAILHDVVEDTPVELDLIYVKFGPRIAGMVDDLTDVSKPTDGNRKTRKLLDLEHTAAASPEAKTIKIADLIDNTKSITLYDPVFAKVYMREKKLLLEVLDNGDKTLFEMAKNLVDSYFSKI